MYLLPGGLLTPQSSITYLRSKQVLLAPSKAILFYGYQVLDFQGQGADHFHCQLGVLYPCNLDPKQGDPCHLYYLQGTGSAISRPFTQVLQGFIESFYPSLQGLRVCLQHSLKKPHQITVQVESPFSIAVFCPALYHSANKMSLLVTLTDLRHPVGIHQLGERLDCMHLVQFWFWVGLH